MSVKEIEDKRTILHTLEKDELVSMIHELLVNIKKSKNRVVSEKQGVRFLQKHLLKIKNQIDTVLKTKVSDVDIWTPPQKPTLKQPPLKIKGKLL